MTRPAGAAFVDRFVTARDGLSLHLRDYGPRHAPTATVVCLPGLTRTAADFDVLAVALSQGVRPRRVLALDYRGRGGSAYDPNPDNYTIPVELDDVATLLTACEVAPAVVVGSSRGGLLAMAMAAARPSLLAGVVLVDIGPVIDIQGLMRIKSYVGKLPEPTSFEEGAEILRRAFSAQFPKLTVADWMAWAQRAWQLRGSRLVATYDPNLARTLAAISPDQPLPPLWPQFDALAHLPLMVVRGANSDLLSAATVAAMRLRRPDMVVIEVPDQGHTPLLADPETIAAIAVFIASCDRSAQPVAADASQPA